MVERRNPSSDSIFDKCPSPPHYIHRDASHAAGKLKLPIVVGDNKAVILYSQCCKDKVLFLF
jgi:hypothetical protein